MCAYLALLMEPKRLTRYLRVHVRRLSKPVYPELASAGNNAAANHARCDDESASQAIATYRLRNIWYAKDELHLLCIQTSIASNGRCCFHSLSSQSLLELSSSVLSCEHRPRLPISLPKHSSPELTEITSDPVSPLRTHYGGGPFKITMTCAVLAQIW